MPKIILTIGASCSGKTSWAEDFIITEISKTNPLKYNWVNLNRDEVRFSLFTNGVRDWTKYKFKKANEKRVTDVIDQQAFSASIEGKNIIVSDTNLNPNIRDKWKKFAEEHNYEYEEKLFFVSWETLVKRNAQRVGGLSESLLWNQYMRFEQQFGDIKPYLEEIKLPYCVICDIDGTIASMEGRSPFEWSRVGEDKPRIEVLEMVEQFAKYRNLPLFYLSGRDGSCFDQTEQWLYQYTSGWWEQLYIRETGDPRKDSVIKDELYEKHIRGKYNVAAVFDDRRQMIRHWTLKGMPNIIDVGNYNEEF